MLSGKLRTGLGGVLGGLTGLRAGLVFGLVAGFAAGLCGAANADGINSENAAKRAKKRRLFKTETPIGLKHFCRVVG